ncbi:MAG TPA: ABC transporter permease [Anaerolineales bacterium]|nr:ABC transporter permease [Anaerolineales bacterium]
MARPLIPRFLADSSTMTKRPVTNIRPPKGLAALDLHELWAYRELLYFLVWRDVKVRYKQTAIGVAWVVLQPFLTMVVFSIVFGKLMHVPSGETPYPVFAFVALLPWTFFAGAISRSGNSLIYDANLVSKVYFPRVILPLAAVLSNLVDFGVAFIILIGMMLILGVIPGVWIFTLPLFLLLALITALAIGLWLSALNVKYRDIGYVIPFLIQLWLFLTPVAYPITIIPDRWRLLYSLNPMVGVVEGFRWAVLGQQNLSWNLMLVSILLILALFIGGLSYFRRMEFEFADVV